MGNPAFTAAMLADASLFVSDFSVAVVHSGTSYRGVRSYRDELVEGNGSSVIMRRTVLKVTATVAAAISDGDQLVADGTTYRVDYRQPAPPDGLHVDLILAGGGE